MIEKAYRCRLYPNKEQAAFIERTFGACRWVWNMMLETKSSAYKVNKKTLSMHDLQRMLPKWKAVIPWLKEAPSSALVETGRDLDKAYQNFFRRVKKGEKPGFPKWKRKSAGTQSYRTQASNKCLVDNRHIKLSKLGVVKCRITQPIEGRVLNVTVKRVPSGKYYVIICCTDVPEPEMPMGETQVMGVDAGLRDLMIRSDGVKVPNPRYAKQMKKKLRREQRKLSRRKGARKGERPSNNYLKQRRKVALIKERIANQRRDHTHKATTEIVRASKAVATENLNVKGMAKDRHIAYSVGDTGMAEAIRQLEYKCAWYGRDFAKVDRWFPSSKTCGCCGEVFKDLKRGDEHWTCPSCGAHHDRDLNAARNIARQGEMLLYE